MERTNQQHGLLRTYMVMIGIITLLTMGATVVATSLRPGHYVSSADVVVRAESVGGGTPLAPNMGTERQIAESGNVVRIVATRLGLSPEAAAAGLSVSVLVDTTVLEISYTASAPEVARHRAMVFANAYISIRIGKFTSLPAGTATKGSPPAPAPVVAVISPATLPTAPAKHNYVLLLGISLLVGAMLGAGCALIWDRVSGRLRNLGDLESHTGLPVLASVPALDAGPPDVIAVTAKNRVRGAEAYGYLTARTTHLLESRGARSLLVTSPTKSAGKTSVAVNLAASLALLGKGTVLVSSNPGSTTLEQCFDLDQEPGFVDVLGGTASLPRALHSTEVAGLKVLPSGRSRQPGDLTFNVEDLSLLLQQLSAAGDIVIFDGPPVLGNAEAALIADKVDLVLLVVDMRRGKRADAAAAVSLLGHLGSRLAGVVANCPGRRLKPPVDRGVPQWRDTSEDRMDTPLDLWTSDPAQTPWVV